MDSAKISGSVEKGIHWGVGQLPMRMFWVHFPQKEFTGLLIEISPCRRPYSTPDHCENHFQGLWVTEERVDPTLLGLG
jgi:hypothetical protein